MAQLLFQDIARSWYLHNPVKRSGEIADNTLFRMLYNAYCRRSGNGGSFDDIVRSGDYSRACAALYCWYERRYAVGFRMPTGTQGQKRTVTFHSEEYTFDLLYCDDRQFKNYLITGIPLSGSQDLLSFVLHTAVAFLVPPAQLDEVLQHLGFHPLHVKNIHHLAICYVLLGAENRAVEDSFNPFAQVRALYLKAQEILDGPEASPVEGYSFADQETRMIREALFLQKALSRENFENLIAINKDAMNMRHSRILADFHKLTAVFIHLYDSPTAVAGDPESWQQPEEAYSFYAFVEQFCKEDLSRKKYREQLTGMIDRYRKHPTRNVMILLWLHAYCFATVPGVYMEKTAFNRIVRLLKKENPHWAAAAKTYYTEQYFDVWGFITDSGPRLVPETFNGADFVTHINEKLLMHYGWGPLNARLPFDYYIRQFEKLVIREDSSYGSVRSGAVVYDGDPIMDIRPDVDNVPYPLVAISQILTQLKNAIAERTAMLKTKAKPSDRPLKCSLYEQV